MKSVLEIKDPENPTKEEMIINVAYVLGISSITGATDQVSFNRQDMLTRMTALLTFLKSVS